MGVLDRVGSICRHDIDERALRVAVLDELRRVVSFDWFVWLLTDPATCVGASPVAHLPDGADLPGIVRAKYLSRVNRWTELTMGSAATWVGVPEQTRRSDPWCAAAARHGTVDVSSAVLRDAWGCWGFIDLWRASAPFTQDENDIVGAVSQMVVPALRRALLRAFSLPVVAPVEGPAMLLLTDDLDVVGHTQPAVHYLHALLPTPSGTGAVPAAALNAAAQLLANRAAVDPRPPRARVEVPGMSWMTTRAAPITGTDPNGPSIAVSIEPTPPVERADLYARVAGLSQREAEVLATIATGHDTRRAAQTLGISDHTVQDHLKAIFVKTGADSRRQLVARATGA